MVATPSRRVFQCAINADVLLIKEPDQRLGHGHKHSVCQNLLSAQRGMESAAPVSCCISRPACGDGFHSGVETHAVVTVHVGAPKIERFQPPKLWKRHRHRIGTLIPYHARLHPRRSGARSRRQGWVKNG